MSNMEMMDMRGIIKDFQWVQDRLYLWAYLSVFVQIVYVYLYLKIKWR